MTRVIITGGAGFIGSHIADQFVASGASVAIIDNLSSGNSKNLPSGAVLHEIDIRDEAARGLILDFKPDIVIHAAAQISVTESMKDPALDADINVRGFVNLLQGCMEDVKPYFVFISTGGAMYGDQQVFPAPETHPARPSSFYGLSKQVGENYLDLWRRSFGLSGCTLRLANVYGPRQNPHGEAGVIAIFAKRILNNASTTIYGDGGQTRDFVYVEDVARAVMAACQQKVSGVFNIGTGIETDINTVYNEVASALQANLPANKAEARPGEQRRSVIDASLAKATFSWAPSVSFKEGIRKTVDWFKRHN